MTSSRLHHVLVTGADGALGSAVCARFASEGWHVLATSRSRPTSVDAGAGKTSRVNLDLTSASSITRALDGLTPDALIHCAGGFRMGPLDSVSDEDLDFLLDTNLRSAVLMLRAVLPGMKTRNFGRVVFVSSRSALHPSGNTAAYAASKAGLNALTLAAADEVRPYDITINAVLPTTIDTPQNRAGMPDADVRTWVPVDALAGIIFTFTQESHRSVNGALLPVAGRL